VHSQEIHEVLPLSLSPQGRYAEVIVAGEALRHSGPPTSCAAKASLLDAGRHFLILPDA
jgi:hypothetical protein